MFDQITLDNGLRIVGERLTHVRSCTVGVWVKVGSANEELSENGLSHLIEHMVFKGTQTRSARDIAEEMDMVGGQMNAFTSKECTCYYAKVIDDDLRLAVDILSDLSLRPVFDEKELAKERGVVLEEIAMVEDTPEDLVHELLCDVQYDGSLKYPILGPASQVKNYSRADVLAYWQKHYIPQNMVLAIAGNYDWDEFVSLAEQYFSEFPNLDGDVSKMPSQIFLNGRKGRDKETEQIQICLGYPGFPSGSDDQYAMSVFNNALGGGMSSRLFQRIREEMGMAYSVYSYASAYSALGVLNVYAGTTPDNAEIVIKEMQSEMKRFLSEGISEKEFQSAKAQLRSGFVMGLESSSGRMQSLGRSLLTHGRLRKPEETLANIDAVTMDKVMEIANQVLTASPSMAVVGKKADQYLQAIQG